MNIDAFGAVLAYFFPSYLFANLNIGMTGHHIYIYIPHDENEVMKSERKVNKD